MVLMAPKSISILPTSTLAFAFASARARAFTPSWGCVTQADPTSTSKTIWVVAALWNNGTIKGPATSKPASRRAASS